MAVSLPKTLWDFKNKATRDRAAQLFDQMSQTNSNMGLIIGTILSTLQKDPNMDMTRGYIPEQAPTQHVIAPAASTTSQKPQTLPKQDFVQPALFNVDEFR